MRSYCKHYLIALAALALGFISGSANAHCDHMTGGGFVVRDSDAKGTFSFGGGCKHGEPWGHLEYHDHGTGLNVHWLTITAYIIVATQGGETDPKRTGWRQICGTARTNQFGDVDFKAGAIDNGEPGTEDMFAVRLCQSGARVYTTEFDSDLSLGGSGPGGGNIQLHKPNDSTREFASGTCSCN
jgi:hypothetical protein